MTTKKKLATAVNIAVAALALTAAVASAAAKTQSGTDSIPTMACPIDAFSCLPGGGDHQGGKAGDPSIMFAPLADKTFGDPDFTVHATASSGLRVSFTAIGDCMMRGRKVHITSAGDCTITASQAGDATHKPAKDVVHIFSIAKGATATAIPASGAWGAPLNLPYWIRGKGNVATSITVEKDGSTVAHVGHRFANVKSGHVYALSWNAPPANTGGAYSFCVTLNYRAHVTSETSCARIQLR